ncbi:hypothetical protein DEJ13_00850 [Curtobacterium sp. MCLR17_007]|uniref:hypothetical protein n=1 Tax=Curtobacterium sp. MCLR17_007 TaxID=2175648 RepID=UPI000DAA7D9F|nr:hypothetical protein [Curtobacterium sp. MCLR17_007]WIB60404.1 hypothetical protein DEJ13_00850 [Curtobacterium sp. MCLR17_007]
MSSFRHPVGPQKPGVYWRRRLTVLGAVAIVVIVVVLIVVGRGNGAPSVAASGSPSASPRAAASSPAPAASASSAPSSGSSSPGPSASASAADGSAADGDTCGKGQIALKPVLDKSAYGPTEDPKIAMSIENTGSKSCHMDLGSAQQVLTISSGEEQYWSSKDCQTGGTNQDVTIKAGQTLTTPAIAWDRTRSSTTTCDSSRPSVTGGGASYHLQVSVGNITSADSAQFILN